MAKTEMIKVRIEPETKERAAALFGGMGLSLSGAVSLFIQQSLNSDGLPFSVEKSRKNDNYAKPSQVK